MKALIFVIALFSVLIAAAMVVDGLVVKQRHENCKNSIQFKYPDWVKTYGLAAADSMQKAGCAACENEFEQALKDEEDDI